MSAHILVVDDDARLRSLLERYLKEQGYAVSTAEDTLTAKRILSLLTPDVMVLDVMMPNQTGLEFSHELKEESVSLPILMLTAMDSSDDRIAGLESGVEDYLTKPFEPRELLLRLGNILKRTQAEEASSTVVQFDGYAFSLATQQLTYQQEGEVSLTTTEREILTALATVPNKPLKRDELAMRLGGGENLRHVDVQVGRLRKKLGESKAVQTVRGKGYKLVVEG